MIQTALVRSMPWPEYQGTIYSVYRTDRYIELHPGCDDREGARLICSHKSYEDAYEFGEILAAETGLPLHDLSDDSTR